MIEQTKSAFSTEQLMQVSVEDWLDGSEVMRLLKISKRTLQTLRDTGKLPYSHLGGKIYYCRLDIQRILADNYMRYRLDNGYGMTR